MLVMRLCGAALVSGALTLAVAAPASALKIKFNDLLISSPNGTSDLPAPPQPQVTPGPPTLATPDPSSPRGNPSRDHAWGSHQFVLGGSMRTAKTPSLRAK